MSLSAWEQQALDTIKDRLAGSDPALAGLLATFNRLASGEDMPARERIRPRWWQDSPRAHRRGRPSRAARALRRGRRLGRRLGFRPAALLLLWFLPAVTLVTVTLAVSRGGGREACSTPWLAACTAPAPTHAPQQPGG